ncbi:serine/threonine-protein kinase [Streptomyces abyssomicinicus]|uniref:serine/threonine-protein kinase n=1 Tax=Streptomyces abyssomicinicus TaxID=574929 RepID=UPI0013E02F8D|nr:serine/threonine-protein kinase [Streptomyces abyssomicinicus]
MREQLGSTDPRQIGPYVLVGTLGRGRTGRVFLGRSRGGRLVAVKVVDGTLADDPEFRVRFAQAARAARGVGGFYAAQVLDAGPDDDPPWLASAYVAGPSLEEAVRAHGPLPYATVRVLGSGLAEGIAALHGAGLVHGGLKPGNVILSDDGPRITDFALAQAVEAAHPSLTVSIEHGAFMAPETARGQGTGPESDVFSLAGVLVFAATGRGPFAGGAGAELLHRVVHAEPDLTGVPEPLAGPLAACLAKNPAERPGLDELLARLAHDDGHGAAWLPPPVAAMVDGRRDVPEAAPVRRRALLLGAAGAAAAVAVTAGLWLASGSDGEDGAGGGSDGGAKGRTPAEGAALELTPTRTLDAGKTDDGVAVAYSRDGKLLAAGLKNQVVLWDTTTGSRTAVLVPKSRGRAHCVTFGADGLVALGSLRSPSAANGASLGDGGVTVWDTSSHEEVADFTASFEGSFLGVMESLAFSPDGRVLVGTGPGPDGSCGELALWDMGSAKHLRNLVVGAGRGPEMSTVHDVAFSPDGKLLAAGYGGALKGGVVLYDTASWSEVATLPLEDTDAFGITTVAFTPDGKTLAATFGGVALWDVATRKLVTRIGEAGDQKQSLVISPDGSVVAAAGGGHAVAGHIGVWDLASHKELVSVPAGRSGVGDMSFHPDGSSLATAHTNAKMLTTVQLWSVG